MDHEEPHVVKEFSIGETKVKIADNFCRNKTEEDIQLILKEAADIVMKSRKRRAIYPQLR